MSEVKEASNVVTSENREAFMAHRMGLSIPEVADAEIIEEKKVEPTEQEEIEESEVKDKHVDDEPGEDGKEKKNSPKLQKRFSELTRQREEARQEAAKAKEERAELERMFKELEGKLEGKVSGYGGGNTNIDSKPDKSQFTDWGDYTEAMAKWSAKQALAERDKQDAEKAARIKADEINSKWNERVKLAKSEIEDYDEVVASSDVKISDVVRDAILESDVGPQIIYHLAEDSEFADKLNQMTVQDALKAIGRLEAKFEKQEPVEVKKSVKASKAPAPISPIKAASVPAVELDENGNFAGSFAAYKAARKAGRIK